MCHVLCVPCHKSPVICCVSPVTCHMLRVTCHLSHVTNDNSHSTMHSRMAQFGIWYPKLTVFSKSILDHLWNKLQNMRPCFYFFYLLSKESFEIVFHCPRTFVNGSKKTLKKGFWRGQTDKQTYRQTTDIATESASGRFSENNCA